MGYTNYWYRKPTILVKTWTLITADVNLIIDARKDILCFEYDEPEKYPQVDKKVIRFNGKDEDGHETFYIDRVFEKSDWDTKRDGKYFACCKTARKPYDEVCQAVLLVFKRHLGDDFVIASDGDWEEEWKDGAMEGTGSGRALFLELFGYHSPLISGNPLKN